MANEIKLTIKVDDNGSLQIVAKNAEKAAKATEKVAKATKQAGEEVGKHNVRRNKFNMMEKGAAELTNNSTRAFAKQAKTLGGTLVPAYATLAANIFALTALFGALRRAAAVEQLSQGLVAMGEVAGQNLPKVAERLKEITGYAISTKEAMSSVALGSSAGFSTKQLEDLTKVAKGASLALGRDMEDAMSRLVRGTAKIEPEILDELGIMVRLDKAAADYAAQLGKSATQLTQFERRQAFLNATIDQGLKKFGGIAEEIDPNPYDQLAATFNDLAKAGLNLVNNVLGPLIGFLSSTPTALLGVLAIFATTLINKIAPGLEEAAREQQKIAEQAAAQSEAAALKAEENFKKMSAAIKIPEISPKAYKDQAELYKQGSLGAKELENNIKILERSERSRQGWIKRYQADNKKYTAEFIASKEAELVLTQKEIEKNRELLLIKKKLGKAGLESAAATTKSALATEKAKAFTEIGEAGPFGGFKIAAKSAMEQFRIVKEGHKKLMSDLVESSEKTGITIGTIFSMAGDKIKAALEKTKESFNKIKERITSVINSIMEFSRSMLSISFEFLKTEVLSRIQTTFVRLTDSAIAFKNALKGITLEKLKANIVSAFVNIKDSIKGAKKSVEELRNATASLTLANLQANLSSFISNFKDGFKNLINSAKSFKNQISQISINFSKLRLVGLATLNTLKGGLLAAAGAATVFGRALLNAIPIIGQILFFGSLLVPIFKKLFGKNEVQKAIEEQTKSFEDFSKVGVRLKTTLDGNVLAHEKYAATLKSSVGIIRQVESAFESALSVQAQKNQKDLAKLHGTLRALWDRAEALPGPLKRIFLAMNAAKISKTNKEISNLKNNLNTLAKEDALTLVNSALDNIRAYGDIAGIDMEKAEQGLNKLRKRIQEEGGATEETLRNAFKAIIGDGLGIVTALDSAADANAQFQKEVVKYSAKSTTSIDGIVTSVETLAAGFDEAAKGGIEGIDNFLSKSEDYAEVLDKFIKEQVLKDQEGVIIPVIYDTTNLSREELLKKANEEVLKRLKEGRQVLAETPAKIKEIQNQLKIVGKISKDNASAAEYAATLEQQASQQKLDAINAELFAAQASGVEEEKIAKLTADQAAAKLELALTEVGFLEVKIAQVKQEEQIIALIEKQRKAITEIESREAKILELRSRQAAAKINREITPQDELRFFQQQQVARVKTIAAEYESTVARAEIETKVLQARNKINRETAILLNKQLEPEKQIDLSVYDELENSYGEILGLAKETALVRLEEQLHAESLKQIELERADINDRFATLMSGLNAEASLYKELGLDSVAAELNLYTATKKVKKLEEELNKDKDTNISKEKTRIKLLEAQLDAYKAQIEAQTVSLNTALSILEVEEKIAKSITEAQKSYIKIGEARAKVDISKQNREINPEDELKLFNKSAKIRSSQYDSELTFTLTRLDLETQIARIKTRVFIMAAKAAGKDTTQLELELRLLEQSANAAADAAIAKRAEQEAEDDLTKATLERALYNAELNAKYEARQVIADRLVEIDQQVLGLQQEALNLIDQERELRDTLSKIVNNDLAIKETENALARNHLDQLRNQLAIIDAKYSKEENYVNLLQRGNKYLLDSAQALAQIAKAQVEQKAALQGRDVSALESLNLFKEQRDLRKKIIDYEFEMTVLRLHLEAQAEIEKLRLQQEAAKLGGANPAVIANLKAQEDAWVRIRDLGTNAAVSQKRLAEATDETRQTQLEMAVAAERMSVIYAELDTKAAIARAGEMERLASGYERNKLLLQEAEIRQRLDNETDPIEKLKIQIELDAKINEILINRLNLFRELADRLNEIAEGSGAGFDQMADITAAMASLNALFASGEDVPLSGIFEGLQTAIQTSVEGLKALGPEGEVVAAIAESALMIGELWSSVFENLNNESMSTGQVMAQAFAAAGATIGMIANIMQKQSNARIAQVDKEIEAEKRRDGQSAQSVAKIKALEKKKEAMKKKAFEQNKKMQMAETIMNTASGIMVAISTAGNIYAGIAMAAIVAAMGAAQLAIIAGSSYEGGGASAPQGPSQITVGERNNTVDLARSRSPSGELAYMRGEQGTSPTGAVNFVPSFAGRATGGNTALLVGEQGPELFIPERPGTIIPADETEKVNGPINVNFSINAIDTQGMQDAIYRQRGNIIEMIREAANSKGELFLESINTREDDAL